METFNFPKHKQSTKYDNDASFRVKFGRGYQFASKPAHPGQRIFTLYFTGMKYCLNGSNVVDATIEPTTNVKALEEFYQAHGLYEPFIYPHPVYGDVTVRFNQALEVPKGVTGGFGVVEDFTVELIEQP